MKTKNAKQNVLDSTIGLIITTMYFQCNDCGNIFCRAVAGIVRRVSGKLIVTKKGKPDKPFKVGKCLKCRSKNIDYIEFL